MNNCIGYGNYRHFLQTVTYVSLGCAYGSALLAGPFYDTMARQFRAHGFKLMYSNGTGMLDLPGPRALFEMMISSTTTADGVGGNGGGGGVPTDVVVRAVFPFLTALGLVLISFLA